MKLSTRRGVVGLALSALPIVATGRRAEAVVPRPYSTEIIVRTPRNVRNQAETVALVALAARHNVAVINISAKQDEDDELPSGAVFYNSAIAPRATGYKTFDALQSVIGEAHRQGIKVRAWVPQFHDQVAGRKNADWQMKMQKTKRTKPYFGGDKGEFFVNPMNADVQAYQRTIVEEIVRNYDIDGLVLDWLRFDDYNMDLGDDTRKRFTAAFNYDPTSIDFDTDNAQRTQWNAWRTAQIAGYVESVRRTIDGIKPGLDLGIYILPPEFVEVGQDCAQFSQYVSFVAPMVYFDDWGYPLSWVHTNVLPQTREKAKGTSMIPTMDTDWSDAAYEDILGHMRKQFPEIKTLSWFVYGLWTEATMKRIDQLRSI